MLPSALRRSTGARALRGVSAAAQAQHLRTTPSTSALLQRRTFLTSPRATSYVMARAKVLHLAARSFLAYNQIIALDSASSPLSHYFARSATLRERVYMYLVCLIPPDQPIDLPDFLDGARQAAHVVLHQIYSEERAHNLAEKHPPSFVEVASEDCVDEWANKLEAQRQALRLPVGTTFKLEKLEVHDARLAEAEYEYSDAAVDQGDDTCSMYHMNEAVCMKVRYAVTEHLLASRNDGEDHPTRHTLKTTFDWSFYSDVSRARLVDWQITKATPFKLELATDKRQAKAKIPAAI
ncbi:hypothetical protein PHYPSEUDO_002627 [Phytophthora pseudosyringae]|uniref:Uncharacterized protein n=1 Tax=Phytophthora pseudosyringae TaxID=221518 RepID=A0A8T1VWQ8_9STRA|nr:hypothetical protein PHYPSEUDO_002627 [Phytophthora pseudosyringae]